MRLSDFDYELPPERIAQAPAPQRDASRLLVLGPKGEEHRRFAELPGELEPGSVLFFNDAKVIPARLFARKPSGGQVEIFFVEALGAVTLTGGRTRETWRCLARGKLEPGMRLGVVSSHRDEQALPELVFGERSEDGTATIVMTTARSGGILAELEAHGDLPLPPYIARPEGATADDKVRYQTVYARVPGAVAAPTAGLHFTEDTLAELKARGIEGHSLTLVVGPGTFAPVRHEDLSLHVMHQEAYVISPEVAEAHREARRQGRPIVAVGTTVVRALESAYDAGQLRCGSQKTDLFIRPGYRFRAVDRLITNFHLPKSTLLMLVCAFAGTERVLAAYRTAVALGYRFFSYGDAMLVDPQAP
jgi:S-adenosylmethionine:tRNA ribosyltransferase-isomerase